MADKNIVMHPIVNGEEDASVNLYPETTKENIVDFSVESGDVNSGSASAGQVLVADGSGGASFETLDIRTYREFPSAWLPYTRGTTAAFCAAVNSDVTAVGGMAYLGELRCSDLPSPLVNVEAIVEIINDTNLQKKVIHITISSGNSAPYRWEYTYWNNKTIKGWIGFQPALTAGDNITINANTNTISAVVPAQVQSNWSEADTDSAAYIQNKPTLGTSAAKDYTSSVTDGSADLVTSGAVYTAIDELPEPMVFKGSVGTSGTVEWANLPAASSANVGYTYKVITAHDTTPICSVGDTIISSGSEWVVIPSGDEPSGTVTSVNVSVPNGLTVSGGPVTSSGTIAITYAEGYSIPSTTDQQAWSAKSDLTISDVKDALYVDNGTEGLVFGNYSSENGSYTCSVTGYNGSATSVVIPSTVLYNDHVYSVIELAQRAFRELTTITSVVLPDGLVSIGSNAFYDCSGLTSITIPDSVTSIGVYAFNGCSGLTSITIPSGVTSINVGTFGGCSHLTSVVFSATLTTINERAFAYCTDLTSISLPDSVTFVQPFVPSHQGGIALFGAFSNCSDLTVTFNQKIVHEISGAPWGGTNITVVYNGLKSEAAASGGTATSLVTTGEKYNWDSKQVNVIEGVQVNGTDLVPDANKKVNVVTPQANWNESDSLSPSYIQNKPTLPKIHQIVDTEATHVTNDAIMQAISSTDIAKWEAGDIIVIGHSSSTLGSGTYVVSYTDTTGFLSKRVFGIPSTFGYLGGKLECYEYRRTTGTTWAYNNKTFVNLDNISTTVLRTPKAAFDVSPVWVADNTHQGYGYKGTIYLPGTTTSMRADVNFSAAQAASGDYIQSAETIADGVVVYSKVNTSIVIPSVVVYPLAASTRIAVTTSVQNGTITGPATWDGSTFVDGTPLDLVVVPSTGYGLPAGVTVSGANYTYDSSTGALTINSRSGLSSSIIITVDCPTVLVGHTATLYFGQSDDAPGWSSHVLNINCSVLESGTATVRHLQATGGWDNPVVLTDLDTGTTLTTIPWQHQGFAGSYAINDVTSIAFDGNGEEDVAIVSDNYSTYSDVIQNGTRVGSTTTTITIDSNKNVGVIFMLD